MGVLRKASTKTTKLFLDETDYIEVYEDISKANFNRIARDLPPGAVTTALAIDLQEKLFEVFVTDWSLTDEKGKPAAVTIENFRDLTNESADLISEKLAEHYQSLNQTPEESKEPETSPGT